MSADSAEQAGGQEVNTEVWQLADGAEVPAGHAMAVHLSLQELLQEYGALAAVDLVGLAEGRQPTPTPWHGDMRPVYVANGMCELYEDGSAAMHGLTADIVRNALHVNPQDEYDFRLTDPREPFAGFEG